MANPVFMPPTFAPGPPTTPVRESITPLPPYNGQTQTAAIVNSQPAPPRQTLPSAGDKTHSKIK